MNNDLNHNLVCRNGNTIKTTFHVARQREAVQQLTYEHAYKVARVYEGEGGGGGGSGGGGGQREDLNGMHSALCVTSEFHEYVYGKRGKRRTSGLSRFVFERFAMRERESCADVCSEKCLVVASYQDKLILMPDTVVDVCTQAWISATDDYLSRDNGTMGCTACVLHDA